MKKLITLLFIVLLDGCGKSDFVCIDWNICYPNQGFETTCYTDQNVIEGFIESCIPLVDLDDCFCEQ
jgi:hypothetical protein